MASTKPYFARMGWVAILLLGAFWAGTQFEPRPAARAAVHKSPPREAFLAGSERSIPVLQEISATLKRIEDRLSRIEKTITAAARK